MKKNNNILKKAFESVMLEEIKKMPSNKDLKHVCSNNILLNKNNSFRKFNTIGRKIAIAMCSFLIITISTVFAVKDFRESIINAVQNTLNKNNNTPTPTPTSSPTKNIIAGYIPNDVKKIVATNYMSDINNPTQYSLTDKGKISSVLKLLKTGNSAPSTEIDGSVYYWSLKFYGETEIEFRMCGVGFINIITDEGNKVFRIDGENYKEILALFTVKYYLHKSNLALPSKFRMQTAQESALSNLSQHEISYIQKELRLMHMDMERLLISSIHSIKDPKSPYWDSYNETNRVFTDPFSGVKVVVAGDGFKTVLEKTIKINDIIKDPVTKQKMQEAIALLDYGMKNHDLASCFKFHEIIHDYDYFAINYPVYFETFPPPDWGGISTYFGNIKLIILPLT